MAKAEYKGQIIGEAKPASNPKKRKHPESVNVTIHFNGMGAAPFAGTHFPSIPNLQSSTD